MAKKENNQKSHAAREAWKQSKKQGRPEQQYADGRWLKGSNVIETTQED